MRKTPAKQAHYSYDFLIVAGELSGDLLSAALVRSIRKIQPKSAFYGVGGSAMQAEGVDLWYRVDDLGVTGITEVVLKIPRIMSVMNQIISRVKEKKPVAAILVDYPDFNLRLAKKLKKLNVPVIYYVSPQLWAWRSGRVETIQKYVDQMMVLFAFEKEWYRLRGVQAQFVGHPVLNRINKVPERSECRKKLGLSDSDFVLGLLPGSRYNEIHRILPLFFEAQQKLAAACPFGPDSSKTIHTIIALADTISEHKLPIDMSKSNNSICVVKNDTLTVLKSADFAWVTSGTAALETALLGVPHIVVYRSSRLTYLLARMLIQVENISFANLILKKKAVPELIQKDLSVDRLLIETRHILQNKDILAEMLDNLDRFRLQFGSFDPSDKAAETVLNFVENQLEYMSELDR
ncbi:MAG: lipid-A-disaccharide synthase [bacterium]